MQPSAPAPAHTSSNADAVPRGERLVQAVDAAVRVAVQLGLDPLHRLERRRETAGTAPRSRRASRRGRARARAGHPRRAPGLVRGARAPRPRAGRDSCAIALDASSCFAIRITSSARRPRGGSAASRMTLALVAELLVERDRGRVVREDVQLELRDPRAARPLLGRGHQRGADPARRYDAATIRPRSATCALDGCGSRISESRPDELAASSSATKSAASGWRWSARM